MQNGHVATTFFALARTTTEAAFVNCKFLLWQIDKKIFSPPSLFVLQVLKKRVQKSWTGDAVWHNTFSYLILIPFLSVYWPRATVFLSLPISHKSSSQDKWHRSHSMFHYFTILPSWEWIMHKKEAKPKRNGQQHLHFRRYWYSWCDTEIAEVKIWTVQERTWTIFALLWDYTSLSWWSIKHLPKTIRMAIIIKLANIKFNKLR